MNLTFRGPRPDRAPAHQIRQILRGDYVQVFHACWHAGVVQLEKKLATDSQAVIDAKAAVQKRIVDESLPPDCRARLFEINAHHDEKVCSQAFLLDAQSLTVFDGGHGIMNRA